VNEAIKCCRRHVRAVLLAGVEDGLLTVPGLLGLLNGEDYRALPEDCGGETRP
jgi:hypothetical protein